MAFSDFFDIICKKCNQLSSIDDGLLVGVEYDLDMLTDEMRTVEDILKHTKAKIRCSKCGNEWIEGDEEEEEMITTCDGCEKIIREGETVYSCKIHGGNYCAECAAESWCTVLVREDEECGGMLMEKWLWDDIAENNYEEEV